MPPSTPLDHVLRPVPPWRPNDLTECGLDTAARPVIDRETFFARVKKLGQQRAAMTVCMTCWSTARRWKNWAESPRDVLARDINRYGDSDEEPFNNELRAIAALIHEHRTEFDGYLTGLEETVSLDVARRGRERERRLNLPRTIL